MPSLAQGVTGGLCCLLPTLVAVVTIVNGMKFRRRLDEAKSSYDQDVKRLIAETTSEAPSAAILVRSNESASDNECLIHIPEDLHDFPWAGLTVRVNAVDVGAPKPRHICDFVESTFKGIRIKGRLYETQYVPRVRLKTGKRQNVYSSKRLMDLSPELRNIAKKAFPEAPEKFVSEFYSYSSEGSRIGGSPTWAQDPEFQQCDLCQRRMSLILQLTASDLKAGTDEIVYFWGCRRHPHVNKTTYQLY